jgi:hypothetical protein
MGWGTHAAVAASLTNARTDHHACSPDSDSPSGTHCLHGDIECTGNIQQLCAAKHFSNIPALVGAERNRLWEFVQCQNRGGIRAGVDGVARSCAEEVGEGESPFSERGHGLTSVGSL